MAKVSLLQRENMDPLPASPQLKIADNDNSSVSSTTSSVHSATSTVHSTTSSIQEIVVSETDRKNHRIKRMKLRRRLANFGLDANSNNQHSDNSVQSFQGIMSVRWLATSLDESLDGDKVAKMRKLRRKMTIQVKSLDSSYKSISTGESIVFDDISIVSGLSMETKCLSSLNVKLSFTNVEIREYQLVPGSNPSVSSGPPVELGWAHTDHTSVDIDQWESIRDGRRRLQAQMRIPPHVRKALLLHHGNDQKTIRDATRSALIARKQRMQTLDKLHRRGPLYEKVDKVKRACNIKRAFKKKKEEKELYGS